MFLWKIMDNYPKIIPVTPSYLEHCKIIIKTHLICGSAVAFWCLLQSLGLVEQIKSSEGFSIGCLDDVLLILCNREK